jgi:hypothetical protein
MAGTTRGATPTANSVGALAPGKPRRSAPIGIACETRSGRWASSAARSVAATACDRSARRDGPSTAKPPCLRRLRRLLRVRRRHWRIAQIRRGLYGGSVVARTAVGETVHVRLCIRTPLLLPCEGVPRTRHPFCRVRRTELMGRHHNAVRGRLAWRTRFTSRWCYSWCCSYSEPSDYRRRAVS